MNHYHLKIKCSTKGRILQGFSCFWKLRAFAFQTSLGLLNLNVKGKMKRFLVVVVKWRHRAKGLSTLDNFDGWRHVWNCRGKLGTRLGSAHVDASHFRGARNKCLLPIRKKVNPGSSDFAASPSYCVKGILACLPGPNFAFACVVLKQMISS